MSEKRAIRAGRRSCLTTTQERKVARDFQAWAKRRRRKPTTEEALGYFLGQADLPCLWPEFAAVLAAKGLVA